MSYTHTPRDVKAAKILFHAMLWVASLDGLHAAGKVVVDALKVAGYLQPVKTWNGTFGYNFIERGRVAPLEGEELAYRTARLDAALDDAAEAIDGLDVVFAAYAQTVWL